MRPDPTAAPSRSARRWLSPVLGLLVVLVLAAVVLLALQLRGQQADAAEEQAVLQAARQQAVNLTSIDHATAARDVDRVLQLATGELAEQFSSEREALAQLLSATESRSEGTVLGAGLVSLDGRSATALVAADATVTNSDTAEGAPLLQRYRMSLDLRKVGERWLVERILFAGAPA